MGGFWSAKRSMVPCLAPASRPSVPLLLGASCPSCLLTLRCAPFATRSVNALRPLLHAWRHTLCPGICEARRVRRRG